MLQELGFIQRIRMVSGDPTTQENAVGRWKLQRVPSRAIILSFQ